MGTYTISELTEADFAAVRDEWDSLLASSASDNVFLTWEWMSTWWRHFRNSARVLRVVCARDGFGGLKGIFPLYHEFGNGSGSSGTLRFLGTRAVCSEYVDLIVERGLEAELVGELVGYVNRTWAASPLRLTDIPTGSENLRAVERAIAAANVRHAVEEGEICPFLELPDAASGFSRALKPNMRSSYKRAVKKFQERFGTAPRRAEGPGCLQSAYDTLFALHRMRFEEKCETSSFLSEEMRGFQFDVGNAFLERGWLRFYVLEAGDRVVGSLYCFAYGDRMSYYQAGFDPEYESWGVGKILLGGAMSDAVAGGMKEFDFLRGAEPYKWTWTSTYRKTVAFTAYPRTLAGAFQYRYDVSRRATSRLVRAVMRRGGRPVPAGQRQPAEAAGERP